MTSPLLIASDAEDAAAVEAIVAHHAELSGTLGARVAAVVAEAHAADSPQAVPGVARAALVSFCRAELLPHAAAEEHALYPLALAVPGARLLVEAMIAEHRTLASLVDDLALAGTVVEAVARASALRVLFEEHLAKENDRVVPLLAGTPEVSLAGALTGMHELLGGHAAGVDGLEGAADDATAARSGGGCGGACGCGGGAERVEPVLDVREFPHSLRHAVVFGALDAVTAGDALVLVAPHDPVPLLGQLAERRPGAFAVQYLERGPEAWRLRLVRGA